MDKNAPPSGLIGISHTDTSGSQSDPIPPQRTPRAGKLAVYTLTGIVILALLAAIAYSVYELYILSSDTSPYVTSRYKEQAEESDSILARTESTPTPTPTPKPIPSGNIPFTISATSGAPGPKLANGFIDPYDPKPGERQTIHIKTRKNDDPVIRIEAVMHTDTKQTAIPFSRLSGTDAGETWEGFWEVSDTYLYTYNLEIRAQDRSGTQTVTLTLR